MPEQIQIISKDLELSYDRYFKAIYRFFYYKTVSKDLAEDLTSETFLAFAEKCKKNKKIKKSLKIYLYGIARIVFTKFLQKKYKEKITDFSKADWLLKDQDFIEHAENFDKQASKEKEKKEKENLVKMYIEQLPKKQKNVIYMRLIQRMKLEEICKKLNKDMNYVKVTQYRGLKKLKKLVAVSTN